MKTTIEINKTEIETRSFDSGKYYILTFRDFLLQFNEIYFHINDNKVYIVNLDSLTIRTNLESISFYMKHFKDVQISETTKEIFDESTGNFLKLFI